MWSIHARGYFSATERHEVPTPATTWMSLEIIVLSEISQTQKDQYCMKHLEEANLYRQKVD